MTNAISILGCGWLGLPLGQYLYEKGFAVKGSTTTPDKIAVLAQAGIQPFLISLGSLPQDQLKALSKFLQSAILIINIPPQVEKRGAAWHPSQIGYLSAQLKNSPVQKVIYISSTSVYPEVNHELTENESLEGHNPTSKALLQAEEVIRNLHCDWLILRCGGLMGYNRIPGKYVSGKKEVNTGNIPVNFVHRDDVLTIIYEVIRQRKRNQIYNIVTPEHPKRRDIYAQNAKDFGYELPDYIESSEAKHKIVSSAKMIKELNYQFKYPNPLSFSYSP